MSKTIKNVKEISRRTIVIVSLLALLVFSLISLSFAWYRNYIDITGMKVTTGQISFELETYHVDINNTVSGPQTKPVEGATENSVVLESQVTKVEAWANMPHHVYYFIKNTATETAIDLDASLSLSLDNATIPDEIGAIQVSITHVKQGEIAQDLAGVTSEQIKEQIAAAATNNGIETDSNKIAFSNLETAYREFFVKKGEYVCYRLTYEIPANLETFGNMDVGIRVSFCLAQKGGLPGTETATEYVVYSNEGLQTALGKYRPNDKITVKGNIDYVGDLIFNRPLSLAVQNADFTIQGNLTYAYPYQGHFSIDTSKGGRIIVIKKGVEQTDSVGNVTGMTYVGGNFNINVPKAQMEMLGKNNTAVGRGDIYVQETFMVNTSKSDASSNTDGGFIVNGARIIHTNGIAGDSEELKTVNVGDHTKITVLQYSSLGPIVAAETVIEIENRGTIEKIDLSDMKFDGNYTTFEPQIFIDNYGRLTDTTIVLPSNWANKFGQLENEYTGNTRIVSHPGAGEMKTNTCSGGFKSDGSKDTEKDDIEYVKLHTFVEKVNELPTEIVVQYTEDTDLWKIGENSSGNVKIGSNLQTILEYYSGKIMASNAQGGVGSSVSESLKISDVGAITYMKIVCLNTQLTNADYTYIRTYMKQLRTLDLSDASSENLALPVYAFQNMTNLTTFIPSQYDTSWATNYPFGNTGITELWLPSSLTTITANTFTNSNVQYIHTSSTIVSGLLPGMNDGKVFLFVPDNETYQKYNTSSYYGKVFMDATRYATDTADYFLRLNEGNGTAEFAVVVPRSGTYTEFDYELENGSDTAFDFASLKIGGTTYEITSYDQYSFYKRTVSGTSEIAFGKNLENVGGNAFGELKGVGTLRFKGPTTVKTDAFKSIKANEVIFEDDAYVEQNGFNASTITKIRGDKIERLGEKAFASMTSLVQAYLPSLNICIDPFNACTKLVRVDIGILKQGCTLFTSETIGYYTFVHNKAGDIPPNYTVTNRNGYGRVIFFESADYTGLFAGMATYDRAGMIVVLPEGYEIEDIKEYYNQSDPITINNVIFPNFLYLEKTDGTVHVVLCYDTMISSSAEAFTIPKQDGSGNYQISSIGNNSFVRTKISIVGDFEFPESVKEVGDLAFSTINSVSSSFGGTSLGATKDYGRLILTGVETVGMAAFLGNSCVEILGDKVHTLYDGAFHSNKKLYSIQLPAWRNCLTRGSTGFYFEGCTGLKRVWIGPTDLGTGSIAFKGGIALDFALVDGTIAPARSTFFGFANSDQAKAIIFYKGSVSGGYTTAATVQPFEDICFSNFTTVTVENNGASYRYDVPATIYYKNTDGGTASYARYLSATIVGDTYTIPDRIVETEKTYSIFDEDVVEYDEIMGGEGGYRITAIDTNAFRNQTSAFAYNVLNTGKYVEEIKTQTLRGTYFSAAYHLVLESVETVWDSAFEGAKILSLTANKLKTIKLKGFRECVNLKEVNLPAIESIFDHGFYGCSGLSAMVLGENFKETKEYSFCKCSSLTEVIVLSSKTISWGAATSNVFYHNGHSGTPVESLKILFPASVYETYLNSFSGVPSSNIGSFELSSVDEDLNITYFFNFLANDKVELSLMKTATTLNGTYVFPSSFTKQTFNEEGEVTGEITYWVTKISDVFMSSLNSCGVITEYVLPDRLEEFAVDYNMISPNVKSFEIVESNTSFMTNEDGVLYNKNGTVLIYYPRGKSDSSFIVDSNVTMIAESAFYGNLNIQSVTISGDVILSGGAFEECRYLQTVTITGDCILAGRNIFLNCHEDLVIYVPADKVEQYKQQLIFDMALVDRIQAQVES